MKDKNFYNKNNSPKIGELFSDSVVVDGIVSTYGLSQSSKRMLINELANEIKKIEDGRIK